VIDININCKDFIDQFGAEFLVQLPHENKPAYDPSLKPSRNIKLANTKDYWMQDDANLVKGLISSLLVLSMIN
jgi:hypothetical protein